MKAIVQIIAYGFIYGASVATAVTIVDKIANKLSKDNK